MSIFAIAYVSTAVHPLSEAELEHLLESARERNRKYEVTGALLYRGESFFQYIEGPQEGLLVVYQFIRESPLHRNIIELLRSPVLKRSFSGWWMGFSTPPESHILQLARAEWQRNLESHLEEPPESIGMTLLHGIFTSDPLGGR